MNVPLGMSIRREDFDYIRGLLKEHSGVFLEDGKEYLLEVRLSPLFAELKVDSVAEVVAVLRRDNNRATREHVLNTLLTNETYFFRDIHPFEMLRDELLPEMFAARAARRQIKIWSAACSTGQEPYSIAMIVHDLLERHPGFSVEIVATDLSEENLEKARAAKYTQAEVNRGLPAPLLIRHFRKNESTWDLSETIRRMVTFRKVNLMEIGSQWSGFDVILLRNVLIYFDQASKRSIIGRVRRALANDGAVMLGASETVLGLSDEFNIVHAGKASLYRPRIAETAAVLSGVRK